MPVPIRAAELATLLAAAAARSLGLDSADFTEGPAQAPDAGPDASATSRDDSSLPVVVYDDVLVTEVQ